MKPADLNKTAELLIEAADALAAANWRGDLQEQLREMVARRSLPVDSVANNLEAQLRAVVRERDEARAALARAGSAAPTGQQAEPVLYVRKFDLDVMTNSPSSRCLGYRSPEGAWSFPLYTAPVSAAPAVPTGCELCNSEYGFSCDGKSGQCGAAPTAAVQPPLVRQAVASVVSRVGNEFRVGWLRPERVQVGTLLYCAAEPDAAQSKDTKSTKE